LIIDALTVSVIASLLLIAAGIIVFLLATMLMLSWAVKRRRLKCGGLIMLGPIPIIFGTDKETVRTLIILSIILMIIMLAFFIVVILL